MGNLLNLTIILPVRLLIESLFNISYKAFNSLGLSIVFISGIVSLLTLPLYNVAERIQERERYQRSMLQPQVQRIKKTFSGDEQYLLLSTLYRQNNYHPLYVLRNSLSLIIQVPFFIAAYQFLSQLPQLNGQEFLFLADLGQSDKLLSIGTLSFNLLPIAMTAVNLLAALVYSKGFSISDKLQLYLIAFIFLILLYGAPSGLVLYWTLNNVFSLGKALWHKKQWPAKALLYIGIAGIVVAVIMLFILKPDMSLIKRVIFACIGIGALATPYLLKKSSASLDGSLQEFIKDESQHFRIFFLSLLLLFFLTAVVIPGNLIASSPIEFSFINDVQSPLSFIFSTMLLFAGIWLLWPLIIFKMFDSRVQGILAMLFCVFAGIALGNVFLFQGNYGVVNNILVFDNPSLISSSALQIIIPILFTLGIVFVCFWIFKSTYSRKLVHALLLVVITLSITSIVTLIKINLDFQDHAKHVGKNISEEDDAEIVPAISLSRTEKNIVFLFLDGSVSSYWPLIFDQTPQLKDAFQGFVYFPNTVSFGAHTLLGSPGMMGGYEYTPDEINRRYEEPLVKKHNEATLVLPRLFSEDGYRTYVYDPPLPNHKWSDDYSAFTPYPEIVVNGLRGKFNHLYIGDHPDMFGEGEVDTSDIIRERLPLYSFFKIMPPFFRSIYYDDGRYFLMKDSPKEFEMFLDNYAVLHYLSKLTNIIDDGGAFVFIGNDTPHNPIYLQAPEYLPTPIPTDTYSPLQSEIKYGRREQMFYHVNYATVRSISQWLDYLRNEEVYDNTRIIMVSDHGDRVASPIYDGFINNGRPYTPYQALLLIKDFDETHPLQIDDRFMTNADAPLLAVQGVIDEPINPFTGNNLFNMRNKDTVNVYMLNHRNTGRNVGGQFSFDLSKSFSIKNSIFEESNWIPLSENL